MSLFINRSDDGKLTGVGRGAFTLGDDSVVHEAICVAEDYIEFTITHRSGVPIRATLRLEDDKLTGYGVPIGHALRHESDAECELLDQPILSDPSPDDPGDRCRIELQRRKELSSTLLLPAETTEQAPERQDEGTTGAAEVEVLESTEEVLPEHFEELSRCLLRLGRHGQVLAVAFSPDGKLLASGDRSGAATLSDVASGATTLSFRLVLVSGGSQKDPQGMPDNTAVEALAFSPDSKTIAVGGAGGIVGPIAWPAKETHSGRTCLSALKAADSRRAT